MIKVNKLICIVALIIINSMCIYSLTDNNPSNNIKSINVTVIETISLNITFVPIRNISSFQITVSNNTNFMKKVYPLSNIGLNNRTDNSQIFEFVDIINDFQNNSISDAETACSVMKSLSRFWIPATFFTIGIAPQSFFANIGYENSTGLSCGLNTILVQTNTRTTTTHEISHDLAELCDENDRGEWERNNRFLSLCPNAKNKTNSNLLDGDCLTNNGCEAFSVQSFTGQPDNTKLHNFMGSDQNNFTSWVSNETYSILLNKLEKSFFNSAFFYGKRIMISGRFVFSQSTNTTNLTIDNSYILDEGFITTQNLSINSSKYEINLIDNNSGLLFNIRFNNSIVYDQNGTAKEVNGSYFVFIVPFNETLGKLLFKENNTIKKEVNRSKNIPSLNLTFPIGGEIVSNKMNITYNASDIDGDTINYAILISSDNGNTFSTLDIDRLNTTLFVNTSGFIESKQYKVKILATDGINTNTTISQSTFEIDNDMRITNLSTVYENKTRKVFFYRNKNTLENNLSNISEQLNTGETTIQFSANHSLTPNEEIMVFIEYNYTTSGEKTLTATSTSGSLTETESTAINVPYIEVLSLTILDSNLTKRIFRFDIKNNLDVNLTSINWTFDTNNTYVINSTITTTLQPNEEMFVYIDYNFTSTGTFNVNATAINGSLSDSKNITITV